MARRIFDIAKELGIKSQAIIDKCKAEGIPESTVKNHMSAISAGLEATIREWFSGGGGTAVETAARVDIEQARTKTVRARRASFKGGTTEVAEPPVEEETEVILTETVTVKASPSRVRSDHTAAPLEPVSTGPEQADVLHLAPPTSLRPVTIETPQPSERTEEPETLHAPAAKLPTTDSRSGPTAPAHRTSAPHVPHAPHPPHIPHAPQPPARHSKPAPMNVPTRPTVVAPAGPKLEVKTPVKLSGPKVVRIEAAEQMEAPRPRRYGPPGGPGARPPSGGGVITSAPGTDDDHSRSPRRKTATPGQKRSTGTGVPERRRASSGTEWVGGQIFSEQDLIEREARVSRAGGFLKKRRQDLKTKDGAGGRLEMPAEIGGRVRLPAPFTIKDISAATGIKAADIVKKLFLQGVMATINSGIEPAKAQEIMMDFDIELEVVEAKSAEETVHAEFENRERSDLRPRGPVVTILGHVDHGKTSLLDKIRNANVAAGEAGGITQKTSAFRVPLKVSGEDKEIVFLDTPGHEAFTAMRARGANMTDVVVLVVSAPEGVMPQTIESINHAKAAKVPIVVALNKIDRPDATESQVQRTLGQLAEQGLNPVDWGGDTEVVKTSATTGKGVTELLEALDYQAQLRELKADFGGPARGTVIESRTEEGRGAVANLLVQEGRLAVGDFIVAGRSFGRVREVLDDRGTRLKEAFPPTPVQISGLDQIPNAGDRFFIVDSLKKAQEMAEQRRHREREAQLAQPKVTLDNIFSQMQETGVKEIRVVVKADAQGAVDVLRSEIEKVKTTEIRVRVLHAAVGGIMESDVLLGDASKAIIVGFNVIASGKTRQLAEAKNVEIRTYQVIYDIVDDIKKAAEGLLAPEIREEFLGHADVRAVFTVTKVGKIAGCYITEGVVQRDALIRVTRGGVIVENDRRLEQLKRLKDDAKEVRAGMECGMKIAGYDDIKEGDVLECYKKIEVKRTL